MVKVYANYPIEGLGNIVNVCDEPFDVAYRAMLPHIDGLISLRDMAYARVKKGRDSWISEYGSFVREGSLYDIKNDTNILVKNSLILENLDDAVLAHKRDIQYVLPADFDLDKYLEKIGKDNYVVVKNFTYPTDRLDKFEETRWAFQDQAKKYGRFLMSQGKSEIHIGMFSPNDRELHTKSGIYASQVWFHSLLYQSHIGVGSDLSRPKDVLGIKK